MSGAIYVSANGALSQQMRLEVLSNNLANMNTVGFKEDCATFLLQPESPSNSTVQGLPAEMAYQRLGQYTNFTQGLTEFTGNPLDLAISGSGFFAVRSPQGILYTRKGNFTRNEEGVLVTREGYPVLSETGEIQVDEEEFHVDSEGNVSTTEAGVIAKLRVQDFSKTAVMKKIGDTFFLPPHADADPIAPENFEIRQGYLERSNVNAVKTMTELIESLRVFESYQKAIRTIDEANEKSTSTVGSVAT
jgi:flagellar basal-body rod protein FlgG